MTILCQQTTFVFITYIPHSPFHSFSLFSNPRRKTKFVFFKIFILLFQFLFSSSLVLYSLSLFLPTSNPSLLSLHSTLKKQQEQQKKKNEIKLTDFKFLLKFDDLEENKNWIFIFVFVWFDAFNLNRKCFKICIFYLKKPF